MDFLTYEEILGLTIGHCFSPLQPLVFKLKIKKTSIPVRLRCAWAVVRNLHPLGRVCVGPGQGPRRWVWGKAGSFGKDFFCCADVFFCRKRRRISVDDLFVLERISTFLLRQSILIFRGSGKLITLNFLGRTCFPLQIVGGKV